jgi:hypothetical protein
MGMLAWLTSAIALLFVLVWMAALVWAAIEDGRAARRESTERRRHGAQTPLRR